MKRILLVFKIFLLVEISALGQLVPMSNQYILNPLALNPAYSGIRGALNLALFYRNQWAGIPGAPETLTLAADAPLVKDKVGLGFLLVRDRIGVTNETRILSDYAYKISMGDAVLSFGLGAGLTFTHTANSDLVVLDPGDEVYLADSRLFTVPELTAGVYFSYRNFFTGFSIPRLITHKFEINRNKYNINSELALNSFIFHTGLLIGSSVNFRFYPSVLINYVPEQNTFFDVNANFNILKRFWIGASYRNGRSLTSLFQLQINNQLRAGYSYDFEIGKLGSYSNGSHEIMLRYEFRFKTSLSNPLIF